MATEADQSILQQLKSLQVACDLLRRKLDEEYAERGIPIKNTVSRLSKAIEYLNGAYVYYEHDVIKGNAKLTKAERGKQEAYDLS